MGTLTGAARVALGPDLPPFYTDDEALAADVARHAPRRERSAVAPAACGAPTTRCSIPRWPTSTTSPAAALPARSSARCFSTASSPPPSPGCISISMPGRRRQSRAARRAANARRRGRSTRSVRALRQGRRGMTSIRASPRHGPTSLPHICGARSRRRASSKAETRSVRGARAGAARAGARCAFRHRSAQGRDG